MNIELNSSGLSKQIVSLLHRYHLVLFVLLAIGGLSAATFLLSETINPSSSATDSATPPATPTLDTATMQKIKRLNTASSTLQLPPGRTNPFN